MTPERIRAVRVCVFAMDWPASEPGSAREALEEIFDLALVGLAGRRLYEAEMSDEGPRDMCGQEPSRAAAHRAKEEFMRLAHERWGVEWIEQQLKKQFE